MHLPPTTDTRCQDMAFCPAGQVTQLSLNSVIFRQLPVSGHTIHKQTTGKGLARQNMHTPQAEIIPVVICAAVPPVKLCPRYFIRTPYNGVLASQTRHDYCPQSSMIRGVMSPGLVGRW